MKKHEKVARLIAETVEPVKIDQSKIAQLLKENYPRWKRLWWLWLTAGGIVMYVLSAWMISSLIEDIFGGLIESLW